MRIDRFKPTRYGRHVARVGVVFTALALVTMGAGITNARATSAEPLVTTESGAVRGSLVSGTYAFRGLPFAAAPTGARRWQPPAPPITWQGVRDATQFGPSCPQLPTPRGGMDEDCLFLNVWTPSLSTGAKRPVIVWFHGGGWTQGSGRDYDGTKLTQNGVVVVTVNYRLGALGYLAHPALATTPGGPSGNYGHMDQQASLRWMQQNIRRFGGDPHNVTIAGESAGALSVVGHLISKGSQGLFQRAIIESGSFALNQQTLAQGEAFGQQFAGAVDCPDQTAQCLRAVPVTTLLAKFPGAAIPGIADGAVIPESFASALAAGRFARVPVLNGVNQDEERLFVGLLGTTVTNGFFVSIPPPWPITPESYQTAIATVLSVSEERAATIAAEYPVGAFSSANVAFSTLDNDASWACQALRMDRWLAKRVPTFAYEFNDANAPARSFPQLGVATHTSEIPYIFDLPGAPIQQPFSPDSAALAASMRASWASFAASGEPGADSDLRWPSFGGAEQQRVMSLEAPGSQIVRDFATRHKCAFWAGG
jgi:para-nitrobenzyl esterase